MTDLALVTGGTGFIGSAICRRLLAEGLAVRILHRSHSSLQALAGLDVELHQGDILEDASLEAAFEGVRWVFHAAAQSDYWRHPEHVAEAAINGTRNVLLEASRAGVERVVVTSSSSALGVPDGRELLDENHEFNLPPHRFPYGYAKRQSELAALEIGRTGLDVVIVNPSIVLGPGDLNRISGSLVISAARGQAFLWVDGGINIIHVDDVAEGQLAALRSGRSGERYVLAGENLEWKQVFTYLTEIAGRRKPWLHLPAALVPPSAAAVDLISNIFPLPLNGNQLRMSRYYLWYDTSKAEHDLGFRPERTFSEAARETYTWYREAGVL
ncbi:MAG: NAD-dependent epimerase/dehydratase family protein [Anaerolineales bacterium]